ncbi:MAG: PilZ domain-containing protein [Nitrospinales bacterium]
MDTDNNENNREFSRVPIKIEVILEFEGKIIESFSTQDLSMKGIFIETNEVLPEGSNCEISLFPAGHSDPLKLIIKGLVQRRVDSGMGIKFTEIDFDSYSHLKNLVMLNSSTSILDSVEMEIGDHIGLKKRK